jgi:mRNA-degrading endonuclease RelE of RelBE toxin-antitoxin system
LVSDPITARKSVYKNLIPFAVLKESDQYYLCKKRRVKYMEKLKSRENRVCDEEVDVINGDEGKKRGKSADVQIHWDSVSITILNAFLRLVQRA